MFELARTLQCIASEVTMDTAMTQTTDGAGQVEELRAQLARLQAERSERLAAALAIEPLAEPSRAGGWVFAACCVLASAIGLGAVLGASGAPRSEPRAVLSVERTTVATQVVAPATSPEPAPSVVPVAPVASGPTPPVDARRPDCRIPRPPIRDRIRVNAPDELDDDGDSDPLGGMRDQG